MEPTVTPYARRLLALGFSKVEVDEEFFHFEIKGVLVVPLGKVYVRVDSPDHVTVVQDADGSIYAIAQLIPNFELEGKDVSEFLTIRHRESGAKRLRGRAYVPVDRPRYPNKKQRS